MEKPVTPDYSNGYVANFAGTFVDDDQVPYFVFAANFSPLAPITIPSQFVFYVNALKNCDTARDVVSAWATQNYIDVYLTAKDPKQLMRVECIRIRDKKRVHKK